MEGQVGEHFGRVPFFAIVDTETNEVKVIPNTSRHGSGSGQPPELLRDNGIDIMLCYDLGRRALSMFENFGIEVYIGAKSTVKEALSDYRDGKLKRATREKVCVGKPHA